MKAQEREHAVAEVAGLDRTGSLESRLLRLSLGTAEPLLGFWLPTDRPRTGGLQRPLGLQMGRMEPEGARIAPLVIMTVPKWV